MPPAQEHLDQVRHNQGLIHTLRNSTSFLDWTITVAFYTALHLVEAYFDHRYSRHSSTHARRESMMRRQPELRPVYNAYRDLRTRSEDSRYRCTAPRLSVHDVDDTLSLLNTIESHIRQIW